MKKANEKELQATLRTIFGNEQLPVTYVTSHFLKSVANLIKECTRASGSTTLCGISANMLYDQGCPLNDNLFKDEIEQLLKSYLNSKPSKTFLNFVTKCITKYCYHHNEYIFPLPSKDGDQCDSLIRDSANNHVDDVNAVVIGENDEMHGVLLVILKDCSVIDSKPRLQENSIRLVA